MALGFRREVDFDGCHSQVIEVGRLRRVEASKRISLLADCEGEGGPHAPVAEIREIAEFEKRERPSSPSPIHYKRVLTQREGPDRARDEQAANPPWSDARTASCVWRRQLMIGHERHSPATSTCRHNPEAPLRKSAESVMTGVETPLSGKLVSWVRRDGSSLS
jgi:hypothetical protein